jgi:DNA-directed RNA polymerase subunit omega
MEKLNKDKKVDSQITSRYTIVMAVSKRARQIIDGANPLTYAPADKAVSIAIKELSEGKLLITIDPEALENTSERTALYYQGITSVSKDDLREDFKDKYDSGEDSADYPEEIYEEDGYKKAPYGKSKKPPEEDPDEDLEEDPEEDPDEDPDENPDENPEEDLQEGVGGKKKRLKNYPDDDFAHE